MEYLEKAVNILPVVCFIASAVAAVTPTPWDNRALIYIKKFVDVLALNVGQAKSANEALRDQVKTVQVWEVD